jgi:hypothetical protein
MDLTYRGHNATVALFHGCVLGIAFTILFPIGGALYYILKTRSPKLALDLHGAIQSVALLLAVIGTTIGITMVKSIVRRVIRLA